MISSRKKSSERPAVDRTSGHNLIENEKQAEFESLRDRMLDQLAPVGLMETLLADRVISCCWRLRRAGRMDAQLFAALFQAKYDNDMILYNFERERRSHPFWYYTDKQLMRAIEFARGGGILDDLDLPVEPSEPLVEPQPPTLGEVIQDDFRYARTLVKLQRYEAKIEQSLYRALHELQRLQAARLGHKVAAPVAIDIDVSGPAEG